MSRVEILIKGGLDANWSDWFAGLEVKPVPPDQTMLSGELPDQAAIYGVLSRLSGLGLELVSFINHDEAERDVLP